VHQALERINLQHYSTAFARLGFSDLHALIARSEAGTLDRVAALASMNPPDRHRFNREFGDAAKAVAVRAAAAAQTLFARLLMGRGRHTGS
jgi:hypothetical protein